MNPRLGIVLAASGLLLTGCSPITFLYPIFDGPRDLAADTDLSGSWKDGKDTLTFGKAPDGTYALTWTDGKETEQRTAALVRISNYLFLDLASEEGGTAIRGHEILMVRAAADRLEMAMINPKWLEKKIASESALRVERPCARPDPNSRRCVTVVTAATSELQSFLMRYALDKDAFREWTVLRRAQ